MSYLVGLAVQSVSMRRHKAGSHYNFNIQFPIYTKLLKHVED